METILSVLKAGTLKSVALYISASLPLINMLILTAAENLLSKFKKCAFYIYSDKVDILYLFW